ncbi:MULTISPECIES: flagellar basal-body MS-ring/collar protein FliF [Cryobacterium]|uniref:Flagellar M-ring protein n=1 Tax=Cryobacterium gelidum TaxID=1259164 RepID=A0A4R9AR69_9MICO|nr:MULTISPECIES: flagellar basal-body MS-ring/collar protein FliF [Cryobacterium]TFB66312.1 flagellar M-ring protein FliF [Cryobacterium sp. Hz9]TFD68333.1 flagellar M-ring protein FliF [Cryobacterium gelidum]
MPRQVTSAFKRFGNAIREFTIAQRTVAIIGVAVLVLGIAALSMWVTKPAYTPLFSGLSGEDANSIVEQLRTDGVDYQLADGGATILVPEGNVYDERIKAASIGLPTSSTGGYSLLDTMGVTSSEFQQSVTYKRALEGELAKTIGALDGVKMASVQLAIPEDSVFVSEKNDPTASVFVETQNGVSLTNDQVQAIVHLTSASIDGMTAADVAVVDSTGAVLSAVGVGATGGADQQASDYETRVRTAVQAMLDKVVGAGNATVVVAADMSYESAERVEESFTAPNETPALNESVDTETYSGTGGSAAGVLGSNTATVADGTTDGTFSSESTTRNNAVNKVTESRTIPAGAITRQTVSVAVDADAAAKLNVVDITSLVTSAAGIDAVRGDAVTVEVMAFDTTGAAAAAAALQAAADATAAERFAEILRVAVITAGIVITLIVSLILYARRSRRQSRESVEIGDLTEMQTALGGATAPLSVTASPAALFLNQGSDTPTRVLPTVAFVPSDTDIRRAEIDSLAQSDPRSTAELLRGLMDDRQRA